MPLMVRVRWVMLAVVLPVVLLLYVQISFLPYHDINITWAHRVALLVDIAMLATIGVFLLWFGWFGFNGGSELSADPAGVSWVLVTTCLAAAGGGISAGVVTWIMGVSPAHLTSTVTGTVTSRFPY